MKFCWNCGHKNEDGFAFCEECGVNLLEGTETTETATEESSQPVVSTSPSQNQTPPVLPVEQQQQFQQPVMPKQPMSKKKKIGLILGTGIVVIGVGGYYFGSYYYSYENQVKRLKEVIETKDPKKWAEVMVSTDPSYKISADSLKKLTDYYKEDDNKEAFSILMKELDGKNNTHKDLSITSDGKQLFLYDKYAVEVKPVYMTVSKSPKDVLIEIDGKKEEDNKKETIKVGPLTPGQYEVKGTLKDVSTNTKVDLVRQENNDFEENKEVEIDLHKVAFKVTSNVEGADVLVDDKKVATIKDGSAEIKDLVWHQGMSVKLTKTIGKEVLETEKTEIESSDYLEEDYKKDEYYSEINLTFADIKTEDDISYFLNNFYSDVTSYTSGSGNLDLSQSSSLAEFFANGEDNAEFHDFTKFINGVRSSKEKSRVVGTPEVESFTMTGKDTYEAQYLIEYRTVYQSYKMDDIVQVFRYKKATFRFDEESETFKIVSLGGTDNFEVVDNGGVS